VRPLCFCFLIFLSCAQPPESADEPQTRTAEPTTDRIPERAPERTPDRTPPPPVERNITIEKVEVANPLIVSGRARTFENNVALRVRDANGKLISESFTTAEGEMGQHSPYRGTLWITRDPGDRVTVEALEYSAKDGSEQSLFRVDKPFDVEPIEATLYFPDANCTRVNPYRRRIPKSISLARLLVESLIAGPTAEERASGAAVAFPRQARVQSINLRDGVLTVDFNEALRNVGGSCRAQMIRASVQETLRSLPSVKKVVITAGGSEALALQP
jgi:hypothetical protein